MSDAAQKSANQSDLLLWIAGGAVAAVGAAWLLLTQPWASSSAPDAVATAPVVAPTVAAPVDQQPTDTVAAPEATLDNPLRMAELAYDAGMLVQPEEYSAWTLYSRVLKEDATSTAAREGLIKVADDLVRRGETALEQGRFADARSTVERIRAALPDHAGAKALAKKIWPEVAPAASRDTVRLPEPEVAQVARVETPPAKPARPAIEPIVAASDAFNAAMTEGRLLTPSEQSAKHYMMELNRIDANHELTVQARTTLSAELLSRATQSIEALDPEAAGIWIDEAESLLGGNDASVRQARSALTEQLIAMEAAKPLPASALKVANYIAPEYPSRALERGVEGWVDIEFAVGTDGSTRDIVVRESSHESMFRREATEAVAKWQFEPRVFMGRAIEQRTYTRIRFVL